MSQLRLLELPYLAVRPVLQQMNPMDVFNLSLTSQKMLEVVRFSRLRAEKMMFRCTGQFPVIKIVTSSKAKWEFTFGRLGEEEVPEMKIGVHSFDKMSTSDSILRIHHRNAHFGANILFRYLCSLYQGPTELDFHLSYTPNIFSFIIHPEFQKCDILRVTGYGEDLQDEFEGILEAVEVKRVLVALLVVNYEVRIEKAFDLEVLRLYSARWMSVEDLMSLKCRDVVLDDHTFSVGDVREFVESWLAGGSRQFERLQLLWDMTRELDVRGLNGKPWDPKRRCRYYCIKDAFGGKEHLDCSGGLDIIRSDGRIATLLVEELFEPMLYFLVWSDEQLNCLNRYEEI